MDIAAGKAFLYVRKERSGASSMSFREALEATRRELSLLASGSDVFAAHYEIADDPMLEETVNGFMAEGLSVQDAISATSDSLSAMFREIDDEYLKARADDVRDVCDRIGRMASGSVQCNPFSGLEPGAVIFAEELFPSDTSMMDFSRISALVTEKGSRTSHVCIIARNNGIPCVTGFPVGNVRDGDTVLVDSISGTVIVSPDAGTEEAFRCRVAEQRAILEMAESGASAPAVTRNGKTISVYANAGNPEEVSKAVALGADGIGLLRTEFIYMESKDGFPSEECQCDIYREAASACAGRPLVIRTLDIGGDKTLPYYELPREDNPFLGFRAVRFCLGHRDVFKTQLRAVLRASGEYGNIRIMFPMIAREVELRECLALLEECKAELNSEGLSFDRNIPCGIMVETPASVLMAREFASMVSFFSIGTNDLTQYVMAADRGNSLVSDVYDFSDPSVMKAVRMVADAVADAGISVGMCGEMASDLRMVPFLVESGLDELSVSPASVASVKALIRTL